jgi:cell division protein FtsB
MDTMQGEHPAVSDSERVYQARIAQVGVLIDDLTKLRDWMVANGAGTYTAFTATLGEHQAEIDELKRRMTTLEAR